jgi:large subunit ribosomal protein L22
MVGRTFGKVVPRFAPTARCMYLSIPHRKMRRVAELVVGQPVEKALGILNFTPKVAAEHMARTLKAAVANKLSAEGTAQLAPEDLFVSRIVGDEGPTAKRVRFQSMGRVFRVRKRYCHLSIYLDQRAGLEVAPPKAAGKSEGETATTKAARKAAPRRKTTAGKQASAGKKTASKKKPAARKTAKAAAGKKA